MSILIVEDHIPTQLVLSIFLNSLNRTHIVASNIDEALDALKRQRVSTIILDALIGRDYSWPVVYSSRDLYPDNPPKIILITAMMRPEPLVAALKVDYLIRKPFDLDVLERLLP